MDKRPFKDGHNDYMMMKMMVMKMIWKNPSRCTILSCRMEIMDDKMMDDMNLSWNGEVMITYDGEKRWNMEKVDGDMMGENDNPPNLETTTVQYTSSFPDDVLTLFNILHYIPYMTRTNQSTTRFDDNCVYPNAKSFFPICVVRSL